MMPAKGYTCITIKKSVYQKLNEIAEKEGKSIPALIEEKIIKQYLKRRGLDGSTETLH